MTLGPGASSGVVRLVDHQQAERNPAAAGVASGLRFARWRPAPYGLGPWRGWLQ
jgi:hypothetical protein